MGEGATDAVAEERSCGSHLGYVNGVAVAIDTIVQRTRGVITEAVLDDVVVLDPASGRYVRLNRTSAALWDAIAASGVSVAALARILEEQHQAPSPQAKDDALGFVEAMASRGLVELSTPA